MKMRFEIRILAQAQAVERHHYENKGAGFILEAASALTVPITGADAEKVIETEQFLERILGFRVHINQVGTDEQI